MKGRIEHVKKLKRIELHYHDGTVLILPETKTMEVGTRFMKSLGKDDIEWEISKTSELSLMDKIRDFFKI